MVKRENTGIGLKAKPKKLVKQLAMAVGLSAVASGAWAACTADGKDYTCTGNDTVYWNNFAGYENVTLDMTGNSTSPIKGVGYYLNGDNTTIDVKTLTIKTNGRHADGIRTNNAYNVTFNSKVVIETQNATSSSYSSDGINLTATSAGTLTFNDDVSISVLGSYGGAGVRANRNQLGGVNRAIFNADLNVVTEAAGQNLYDSRGYGLFAGSERNPAQGTSGKAEIIANGHTTITTSGANAYAVFANNEGKIQLFDTTVKTTGSAAHGLVSYVEGVANQNYTGGQIYLTGATSIEVDRSKNSYAMHSKGQGSYIGSTDMAGNKKSGVFNVTGDLVAADQGVIDLNMLDGSTLTGVTNAIDAINGNGTINLNIAGSSSKWNVIGNSNVTELNLANNAQVILGDNTRHAGLDPATRVVLTVDKLSGNGKFYLTMNATRDGLFANYDDEMGDRLVVTGEATGRHKIAADDQNTGGAAVNGSEVLRLVNVQNSTGTSDAVFELENGAVDIGAYKFGLSKEAAAAGATNWVLSARAGGTWPGGLLPLTNIAQHTAGILSTNYLLGHVETQTLLQRMGELRQGESNGDVWGRVYTGKLSSFENKRLSSYGMDYNGMQIGVDRKLDASDNGNVYIGGVVGYAKGDVNYTVGSGQTDSYHVGAYGTYKADSGFYVDGIIKYAHMKNEVNTLTSGGYAVNGNGNTNGFSIGVEAGKRFYTSGKQQGFYVEPQGQLTYGQQNGATISSSNGLRTDLGSYTSVLGRASVILGYDISQGKNPVNVYFKTGYVKEFDGKTSYTFNHFNKEQYDFGGGWWDNSIGVNVQLAGRHHIYGEASYARGGSFDKKQVNVGYRYSF